eukprot:822241-Rhodomonas_salina.5
MEAVLLYVEAMHGAFQPFMVGCVPFLAALAAVFGGACCRFWRRLLSFLAALDAVFGGRLRCLTWKSLHSYNLT